MEEAIDTSTSVEDLYGDLEEVYTSQTSTEITIQDNDVDDAIDDEKAEERSDVSETTAADLDLYDDLITEEGDKQTMSYNQMCEQYEAMLALQKKLESENETLREALSKQTNVKNDLQSNFSSLLITARGELDRKNREITQLRKKLESPQRRRDTTATALETSLASVDSNFEPMYVSSPSVGLRNERNLRRSPRKHESSRKDVFGRERQRGKDTQTGSRSRDGDKRKGRENEYDTTDKENNEKSKEIRKRTEELRREKLMSIKERLEVESSDNEDTYMSQSGLSESLFTRREKAKIIASTKKDVEQKIAEMKSLESEKENNAKTNDVDKDNSEKQECQISKSDGRLDENKDVDSRTKNDTRKSESFDAEKKANSDKDNVRHDSDNKSKKKTQSDKKNETSDVEVNIDVDRDKPTKEIEGSRRKTKSSEREQEDDIRRVVRANKRSKSDRNDRHDERRDRNQDRQKHNSQWSKSRDKSEEKTRREEKYSDRNRDSNKRTSDKRKEPDKSSADKRNEPDKSFVERNKDKRTDERSKSKREELDKEYENTKNTIGRKKEESDKNKRTIHLKDKKSDPADKQHEHKHNLREDTCQSNVKSKDKLSNAKDRDKDIELNTSVRNKTSTIEASEKPKTPNKKGFDLRELLRQKRQTAESAKSDTSKQTDYVEECKSNKSESKKLESVTKTIKNDSNKSETVESCKKSESVVKGNEESVKANSKDKISKSGNKEKTCESIKRVSSRVSGKESDKNLLEEKAFLDMLKSNVAKEKNTANQSSMKCQFDNIPATGIKNNGYETTADKPMISSWSVLSYSDYDTKTEPSDSIDVDKLVKRNFHSVASSSSANGEKPENKSSSFGNFSSTSKIVFDESSCTNIPSVDLASNNCGFPSEKMEYEETNDMSTTEPSNKDKIDFSAAFKEQGITANVTNRELGSEKNETTKSKTRESVDVSDSETGQIINSKDSSQRRRSSRLVNKKLSTDSHDSKSTTEAGKGTMNEKEENDNMDKLKGSRKRPSLCRVISETILSVTSVEKEDSVIYTVEANDELINLVIGNDENNTDGSKDCSNTGRKSTYPTSLNEKHVCHKVNCRIKVNHMHPKSPMKSLKSKSESQVGADITLDSSTNLKSPITQNKSLSQLGEQCDTILKESDGVKSNDDDTVRGEVDSRERIVDMLKSMTKGEYILNEKVETKSINSTENEVGEKEIEKGCVSDTSSEDIEVDNIEVQTKEVDIVDNEKQTDKLDDEGNENRTDKLDVEDKQTKAIDNEKQTNADFEENKETEMSVDSYFGSTSVSSSTVGSDGSYTSDSGSSTYSSSDSESEDVTDCVTKVNKNDNIAEVQVTKNCNKGNSAEHVKEKHDKENIEKSISIVNLNTQRSDTVDDVRVEKINTPPSNEENVKQNQSSQNKKDIKLDEMNMKVVSEDCTKASLVPEICSDESSPNKSWVSHSDDRSISTATWVYSSIGDSKEQHTELTTPNSQSSHFNSPDIVAQNTQSINLSPEKLGRSPLLMKLISAVQIELGKKGSPEKDTLCFTGDKQDFSVAHVRKDIFMDESEDLPKSVNDLEVCENKEDKAVLQEILGCKRGFDGLQPEMRKVSESQAKGSDGKMKVLESAKTDANDKVEQLQNAKTSGEVDKSDDDSELDSSSEYSGSCTSSSSYSSSGTHSSRTSSRSMSSSSRSSSCSSYSSYTSSSSSYTSCSDDKEIKKETNQPINTLRVTPIDNGSNNVEDKTVGDANKIPHDVNTERGPSDMDIQLTLLTEIQHHYDVTDIGNAPQIEADEIQYQTQHQRNENLDQTKDPKTKIPATEEQNQSQPKVNHLQTTTIPLTQPSNKDCAVISNDEQNIQMPVVVVNSRDEKQECMKIFTVPIPQRSPCKAGVPIPNPYFIMDAAPKSLNDIIELEDNKAASSSTVMKPKEGTPGKASKATQMNTLNGNRPNSDQTSKNSIATKQLTFDKANPMVEKKAKSPEVSVSEPMEVEPTIADFDQAIQQNEPDAMSKDDEYLDDSNKEVTVPDKVESRIDKYEGKTLQVSKSKAENNRSSEKQKMNNTNADNISKYVKPSKDKGQRKGPRLANSNESVKSSRQTEPHKIISSDSVRANKCDKSTGKTQGNVDKAKSSIEDSTSPPLRRSPRKKCPSVNQSETAALGKSTSLKTVKKLNIGHREHSKLEGRSDMKSKSDKKNMSSRSTRNSKSKPAQSFAEKCQQHRDTSKELSDNIMKLKADQILLKSMAHKLEETKSLEQCQFPRCSTEDDGTAGTSSEMETASKYKSISLTNQSQALKKFTIPKVSKSVDKVSDKKSTDKPITDRKTNEKLSSSKYSYRKSENLKKSTDKFSANKKGTSKSTDKRSTGKSCDTYSSKSIPDRVHERDYQHLNSYDRKEREDQIARCKLNEQDRSSQRRKASKDSRPDRSKDRKGRTSDRKEEKTVIDTLSDTSEDGEALVRMIFGGSTESSGISTKMPVGKKDKHHEKSEKKNKPEDNHENKVEERKGRHDMKRNDKQEYEAKVEERDKLGDKVEKKQEKHKVYSKNEKGKDKHDDKTETKKKYEDKTENENAMYKDDENVENKNDEHEDKIENRDKHEENFEKRIDKHKDKEDEEDIKKIKDTSGEIRKDKPRDKVDKRKDRNDDKKDKKDRHEYRFDKRNSKHDKEDKYVDTVQKKNHKYEDTADTRKDNVGCTTISDTKNKHDSRERSCNKSDESKGDERSDTMSESEREVEKVIDAKQTLENQKITETSDSRQTSNDKEPKHYKNKEPTFVNSPVKQMKIFQTKVTGDLKVRTLQQDDNAMGCLFTNTKSNATTKQSTESDKSPKEVKSHKKHSSKRNEISLGLLLDENTMDHVDYNDEITLDAQFSEEESSNVESSVTGDDDSDDNDEALDNADDRINDSGSDSDDYLNSTMKSNNKSKIVSDTTEDGELSTDSDDSVLKVDITTRETDKPKEPKPVNPTMKISPIRFVKVDDKDLGAESEEISKKYTIKYGKRISRRINRQPNESDTSCGSFVKTCEWKISRDVQIKRSPKQSPKPKHFERCRNDSRSISISPKRRRKSQTPSPRKRRRSRSRSQKEDSEKSPKQHRDNRRYREDSYIEGRRNNRSAHSSPRRGKQSSRRDKRRSSNCDRRERTPSDSKREYKTSRDYKTRHRSRDNRSKSDRRDTRKRYRSDNTSSDSDSYRNRREHSAKKHKHSKRQRKDSH